MKYNVNNPLVSPTINTYMAGGEGSIPPFLRYFWSPPPLFPLPPCRNTCANYIILSLMTNTEKVFLKTSCKYLIRTSFIWAQSINIEKGHLACLKPSLIAHSGDILYTGLFLQLILFVFCHILWLVYWLGLFDMLGAGSGAKEWTQYSIFEL